MARKPQTDTFELLCGYLEPPAEPVSRDEGESHRDYLERTHTLHTTITVRELDHNIDRDLANREVDTVDLLGRHVVQVGTITDPRKLKNEVVPALLKGDYDYSMLRIRMLSLGDIYPFKDHCPKCNDENDLEVDLAGIETVDMPDPYFRQYTYSTQDEVDFEFRHLTALDLDHLGDILEDKEDEIRLTMGLRLVSVDGVTPKKELRKRGRLGKKGDKTPTPEQHTREAVRLIDKSEVTHREKEEMRTAMTKAVGYPKLIVDSRCKACRARWKNRIQMAPSFFMVSSED